MKFCISLCNTNINLNSVGNKAYNLTKMFKFAELANGFVITSVAYNSFVKSNNLEEIIKKHLLLMFSGEESIETTSKSLRRVIINAKFPTILKNEIKTYANRLNPPYIIRSSSIIEDSEKASFAGLFDSILNIKKDNLEGGIKRVFASLFNKGVLSYVFDKKIDLKEFTMPVLIQEMIKGDKFGTGFLFEHNKERIFVIESTLKDPTGVTSGRKIPDLYVIKKNKIMEYPTEMDIFHLFPFEIYDLVRLLKKTSSIKFPVDIEWAIKGRKLYLLQIRSLTQKIKLPVIFGKEKFSGLPIYPGNVKGSAVVWQVGAKDLDKLDKGKNKVLVANYIPIKDSAIIKNYGGIITEEGGITSHTAILAREYGIPCVSAVRNATEIIHKGDIIDLNGKTGDINLPKREGLSISRNYVPMEFDIQKLKLFKYKNDIAVLYQKRDKLIVSYGYNTCPDCNKVVSNNRLRAIVYNIMEQYKIPMVRTIERICTIYGYLLEFVDIDKGIKREFQQRIKLRNTTDFHILKEKKVELERIQIRFMHNAEENYKKYKDTKNKRYLFYALELFYKGMAYETLIGSYIYDSFSEYKVMKMNTFKRKRFEMFMKELWENPKDTTLKPKDFYILYNKIHNDILLDINIHPKKFTSPLAYLNKVKKVCQIKNI